MRESNDEKFNRERERAEAKAILAKKLLEGLDSGKAVPFTKGHFEAAKKALIEQADKKKAH